MSDTEPRQNDRVMAGILDIAQRMLESGAEVSRVETTIQLLSAAYGYREIHALSITTTILVSALGEDGHVVTQTRRILKSRIDLDRVERLNKLSRQLCVGTLPPDALHAAIEEAVNGPTYPRWVLLLLYFLVPPAFTLFFGGSVWDAIAAMAIGGLVWPVEQLCRRLEIKSLLLNLICSVWIGLLLAAAMAIAPDGLLNANKVIVGIIMLLIPGVALTVSLRDLINGDIITGLLNFCEAVLRALVIAVGVAVVLFQFGGIV